MRRREFIAGLASVAAIPLSRAFAGQNDRVRRVDVLLAAATENDPYNEARLAALTDALRGLGWIDGRNLKLVVHRMTANAGEIRKLVTELLSSRPDVVVSGGNTTTGTVLQATNTVPVVFTTAVDPVGAGYVESLAQPGGNATGFMQFDFNLSGKWLELLKQIAPTITRAGVIRDPATSSGIGQFAVIQSVASSVGIDVVPISPRDETELENGVTRITRSPNAGLIAAVGATVTVHRDLILKLAAQYRLPTVYASSIREALSPTDRISSPPRGSLQDMSIAFSKERNRPIFRFRHPPDTNWSSISKPQRRLASKYLPRCSLAPTR